MAESWAKHRALTKGFGLRPRHGSARSSQHEGMLRESTIGGTPGRTDPETSPPGHDYRKADLTSLKSCLGSKTRESWQSVANQESTAAGCFRLITSSSRVILAFPSKTQRFRINPAGKSPWKPHGT